MRKWFDKQFPNLSHLDGFEIIFVLPFVALLIVTFIAVTAEGIGDALGLAYGDRLNPPPADPSCGIHPDC